MLPNQQIIHANGVFLKVTDSKGWEWRLMLMPDGNSSEAIGWLSVFVEHVNKDAIRMQV